MKLLHRCDKIEDHTSRGSAFHSYRRVDVMYLHVAIAAATRVIMMKNHRVARVEFPGRRPLDILLSRVTSN